MTGYLGGGWARGNTALNTNMACVNTVQTTQGYDDCLYNNPGLTIKAT